MKQILQFTRRNWLIAAHDVLATIAAVLLSFFLRFEGTDLDGVKSSGYGFQIELTYRALRKGFVVKEIPIIFEDRRVGQSKMSRKIFLEALGMVWRLRLDALQGKL